MDVRIGLAESVRELSIEMGDDESVDSVKATIEAAVTAGSGMVWLTDKRGRQFGFMAGRVTFVEMGSGENEPKIGFGAV